jgi:hypothetical protein
VNFIKGSVFKAKGKSWLRIHQIGTILKESDKIKTGANSKVEIKFDDGSLLQLTSDSVAQLKEYNLASNGRNSNINLDKGSIFANVNKLKKESQFQISTKTAIAGVRGTEFFVGIDESKKVTVEVYEGAVAVASTGNLAEKVVVDQGYEATVSDKNQKPNSPQKIKRSRRVEWSSK